MFEVLMKVSDYSLLAKILAASWVLLTAVICLVAIFAKPMLKKSDTATKHHEIVTVLNEFSKNDDIPDNQKILSGHALKVVPKGVAVSGIPPQNNTSVVHKTYKDKQRPTFIKATNVKGLTIENNTVSGDVDFADLENVTNVKASGNKHITPDEIKR